jgi:hypothetical protein
MRMAIPPIRWINALPGGGFQGRLRRPGWIETLIIQPEQR